MVMQMRDIMTDRLVTIDPDDSLSTARQLLARTGFHHLLVLQDRVLVGVVSDRDLLRALSPHLDTLAETSRDLATLQKRVHQIMTRRPVTLTAEATLPEAIALFNQHTISCIPVCNASGEALGIVSWRDIFRVLERRGFSLD